MNPETTTTTAPADTRPLRQIAVVGLPVLFTTWLADFLLWDGHLGVSVGIFFAILGLVLLCRHPHPGLRAWTLVLLLAATCVQSAIDLSLSNVLAALALTVALAGESFQPQLAGLWPRIGEVLLGVLTAPARWFGVAATAREAVATLRSVTPKERIRLDLVIPIFLPALALIVIFGWIFASGNAVFGDLLKRMDQAVWDFWRHLHLTPLRFVWWAFIATLALGLFHSTRAPEQPRWWTRLIPRVPRGESRIAMWQSAMALLAVNALFCTVNTLDAVYLWSSSTLPSGVNLSEFLHQGVSSLMIAVVLSAIVIAGMFQQEDAVANRPWLKRLAHLWVLQNFVLIAGVLRRLQFYTQEYSLTEKRVYVGCFLLLVAAGFLLLSWFVQRRRSFNWLIGRNVIAVWVLFFVLQFVDVAGFVARYNVARWKKNQPLDVEHLANLGPTAWPQLIEVALSKKQPEASRAHELAVYYGFQEVSNDWRGFQWHDYHGRRRLRDYVARKP